MTEANSTPPPSPVVDPKPMRKPALVIDFTAESIQGIKPPTDVDRLEYKDSKDGLNKSPQSDVAVR